jgi:hypothetical protein
MSRKFAGTTAIVDSYEEPAAGLPLPRVEQY